MSQFGSRLRFASCVLGALLFAACGDDEAKSTPTGTPQVQPRVEPDAHLRVLGRAPQFELADANGRTVSSDDLRGSVWVANFFFTRCKATCPLQAERLGSLQKDLASSGVGADVRFVSISVDGGYDQPERLLEYGAKVGADPARWQFLTGSRLAVWRLSTRGFRLPAGDEPETGEERLAHSAKFALVDRRGRIRGYYESSSDEEMAALPRDVETLLLVEPPRVVPAPPTVGLDKVAEAQLEAASLLAADDAFRFTSGLVGSEIGFVHGVVDDAGRSYRAVHYDHGNGVAAGDVDGDGLFDLYFSNQVGTGRLYRNRGNGTFEDATERSGLLWPEPIGVSASFADVDNDGDLDLYVTTLLAGNRLYVNDGKGRFEDATERAGLSYKGHSSAAIFFDFDRDGALDLFLANVGVYTTKKEAPLIQDVATLGKDKGPATYQLGFDDAFAGHLKAERREISRLYRNRGDGTFEDVTERTGLVDEGWSGDATPIDVNSDGWLDLYVLDMQGHDEIWVNEEGKRFSRQRERWFPNTPWGSMGVKVFDFDGDGRLDLFITDMHSDMSGEQTPDQEGRKSNMLWPESMTQSGGQSIWGNALYRRLENGTFVEVSDERGVETYWPWGPSVGDLNADGYEDLFITAGMGHPFRYARNSVLLNELGRGFASVEYIVGAEPRTPAKGRPWFELDCAGRDAKHRECNPSDGWVVVDAWPSSRGSVIFDLDGDGDLDIVANDFGCEPLVLVNDLAGRRRVNRLEVRLEGTRSNRQGLGAIVRVEAAGRTMVQVHDGKSGYLVQSALPLWFGLGSTRVVDRVTVEWPSGEKTVLEGPHAANQRLHVRE